MLNFNSRLHLLAPTQAFVVGFHANELGSSPSSCNIFLQGLANFFY